MNRKSINIHLGWWYTQDWQVDRWMVPEIKTTSFLGSECQSEDNWKKNSCQYLFRTGNTQYAGWQVLCCADPWLPEPFSLRLHSCRQSRGRRAAPSLARVSNQNIWTSGDWQLSYWPVQRSVSGGGASTVQASRGQTIQFPVIWSLSTLSWGPLLAILFIYPSTVNFVNSWTWT